MALFHLNGGGLDKLDARRFDELGYRERSDIQQWLRDRPDILVPDGDPLDDLYVVAEEYGDWIDSSRRIDLLAIDRDGRLVVIEIKRADDGSHMELQAIRYAAMISSLTFDQLVSAHAQYLSRRKIIADATERLLDFLQVADPTEVAINTIRPAIILVSADFSREVTTTVLWLREVGIDIRCVRLRPYMLNDSLLLDATQVIPLVEAESYLVQLRERATHDERQVWPDSPWTAADIQQLAPTLHPAVRLLVNLCAARAGEWVGFSEVVAQSGLTRPQLRGALAGLTMTVKHRFARQNWPFDAEWAGGGEGEMYYRIAPDMAPYWAITLTTEPQT